ncbi:MAG: ankyrin repeat domain-containing protein [Acetobacteraceae bacterium]
MARRTNHIGGWPAASAFALAVILAAPVVHAQQFSAPIGGDPLFSGGKAKEAAPPPRPPSALPGAQTDRTVAPAKLSAASMDPTAALFDAINRDDLAAARDALNRGAELPAHNVLGMTPLQLSIDLNRNDITFLLLSMRAGDDAGPTGGGPAGTTLGRGDREAHGRQAAASTARPRPARAPVVARVAAPLPNPARFAGNGGTPVPAAGFLGFDPTR